jgi:hypothetical protein
MRVATPSRAQITPSRAVWTDLDDNRAAAQNGGYLKVRLGEAMVGLGFCVVDMSLT